MVSRGGTVQAICIGPQVPLVPVVQLVPVPLVPLVPVPLVLLVPALVLL